MAAGNGQAQVQGDATVGTQVTSSDQLNFDIDGGRQVGGNLFQSFRTFSVPINGSADFNSGPTVTNIISRVTGSAASNIDGLIRVPNSDANLFFINPNGIFFGPNARLSLDGSFLASTASQILFAGGDSFSATQPTSLLTVRTPIGLGFGSTAASIQNQSRTRGTLSFNQRPRFVGLQVNAGETLALVGGDIDLQGGSLTAESGRIELASVGPGSRVNLKTVGNNWVLDVPEGETLGNIRLSSRLSQRSLVTTRGRGAGSVQVQGQRLTLFNTNIDATLNSVEMVDRGGTISLRVPGRIVVSGDSDVATRTGALGSAGTVLIETGQLILRDGGKVSSSTFGENNPGDAGRVLINATDLIRVSGRNPSRSGQSAIFSQSVAGATGDAGRVKITTRRLVVENGGRVSVGAVEDPDPNSLGQGVSNGSGGDLSIMATDSIVVTGVGVDENGVVQPSALIAEAQGEGNAGKLVLRTGQLLVQDQGRITVRSLEAGSAGNISVLADTIRLEGNGKLDAETATDSGGNIVLRAADLIFLRQGSMISTSGGIGNAMGNGGNIRITAPLVVAIPGENSDIRTDAFNGNGGAVSIRTEGLFGFNFRLPETKLTNDITANSRFGLDGVVQVNTPDIDPSKDTVALPEVIRTAVLTQGCQAGQQGSQFIHTRRGGKPSEPQEIGSQSIWDDLRPSSIRKAVKAPSRWRGATTGLRKLPAPIRPLQEAQGWGRDARGNLVLLAQAPNVTPNAFAQDAVPCHSY